MRQQGKKWPEIYPVAIFGFANMPFDERSYRKFKLRRAASAYESRRRKKESARRPHQPNQAVRVVSRPADLGKTDSGYGTAESSQDLGPDRAHAPEGGQVPAQRGSG
jgi:hypothetical protein